MRARLWRFWSYRKRGEMHWGWADTTVWKGQLNNLTGCGSFVRAMHMNTIPVFDLALLVAPSGPCTGPSSVISRKSRPRPTGWIINLGQDHQKRLLSRKSKNRPETCSYITARLGRFPVFYDQARESSSLDSQPTFFSAKLKDYRSNSHADAAASWTLALYVAGIVTLRLEPVVVLNAFRWASQNHENSMGHDCLCT